MDKDSSLLFTSAFFFLFYRFLLRLWLLRCRLLLSSCHSCLRLKLGWRSCPLNILRLKSSRTLGCSYLRYIFSSGLSLGFNWRRTAIYCHLANRYWWFCSIGIITLETNIASALIHKWSARSSSRLLCRSFNFLFLLRLNVCKPVNSEYHYIFLKVINEHLRHNFNRVLATVVNHRIPIVALDNRRTVLGRVEIKAVFNIDVSTQVFW